MTRRTAVKSMVASAFLAAGRGRILGANDRINVGMIGLGGRGSWLLELVQKRQAAKQDVQVVALAEVYQKRLNKAASKVDGAKTYLHHQELLQRGDLDAVFIATPDHWHAPITLAALAAGKDVYVEKPMTHTLDEARELYAHARKSPNASCRWACRAPRGRAGTRSTKWCRAGMLGQVVAVQGTYSRNDPDGDWNWADRCRGRPGRQRRQSHRLEAVARRRRRRARSMPTASSASANTGITRAASPRTCITTSWRRSMIALGNRASHARGRHGRTVGLPRRPRGARHVPGPPPITQANTR